jgi:3-phenylpropionate/cinnamic acid dioxygenase small subunit
VTPTLQQVSDRLDIADLLAAYAHAVDHRRWDDLDALFTPDATIDYSDMGGISGSLAEVKEFLGDSMGNYLRTQHLIGSSRVELAGDAATAVSMCHNPMVRAGSDGREHVITCDLRYHDTLARTPGGWRITRRRTERVAIQYGRR